MGSDNPHDLNRPQNVNGGGVIRNIQEQYMPKETHIPDDLGTKGADLPSLMGTKANNAKRGTPPSTGAGRG